MSWFILLVSLSIPAEPPAQHEAQAGVRPTVIVVVGAEGESEFGRAFEQWAGRWASAAEQGCANLVEIGLDEPPAHAPATDRERLQAVLAAEAKKHETAPLWLVLIGHGTYDGREAKFNLRGPDVSDRELADWLKPSPRPIAVINCSSASAPFLKALAAKGRIVITSTRSGSEVNFSRFGDHISAAIADQRADLDKDGQTSLLEAFIAASHRTEEFYKQEARLATEHALLDDNGDALGTPATWFQGTRAMRSARDGAPVDGLRAHQWHLVLSESEQAMPAELRARRDALELQLEALRAQKASLPEEAYYAKLEDLLLKLARLYESSGEAATTRPQSQPALTPRPSPAAQSSEP